MKNGFTLVEILVAMAIVAIMGTILVVIFTNTLRGSNKAGILANIKQNGQAVLENMDKTIRGADNVVCVSDPANTVAVVKNGIYTRYRIALSSDGIGTVPLSCIGTGKNGCIVYDNPAKQIDSDTDQPETDRAFIDRICSVSDPMSEAAVLTDTNPASGVSVGGGKFAKNPQSGFKDSVTVVFTLSPGVSASSVVASQIDPVTFQTTLELR